MTWTTSTKPWNNVGTTLTTKKRTNEYASRWLVEIDVVSALVCWAMDNKRAKWNFSCGCFTLYLHARLNDTTSKNTSSWCCSFCRGRYRLLRSFDIWFLYLSSDLHTFLLDESSFHKLFNFLIINFNQARSIVWTLGCLAVEGFGIRRWPFLVGLLPSPTQLVTPETHWYPAPKIDPFFWLCPHFLSPSVHHLRCHCYSPWPLCKDVKVFHRGQTLHFASVQFWNVEQWLVSWFRKSYEYNVSWNFYKFIQSLVSFLLVFRAICRSNHHRSHFSVPCTI